MTTASIHLLSDNKTAQIHLLSVAKVAISAVARHPRKGQVGGTTASNGAVPLPETVLPQTPFGFPILQQSSP